MSSIKETISSFLDEHGHHDEIVVCTGYVSVKGVAWLARQVPTDRRVTIVIGDTRPHNLARATQEDRRVAAQLLRRGNVEAHTWYRTKPVKKIAHGKAVAAISNGRVVAALVGSANLTETGLSDNLEIMVPCGVEGLSTVNAYIAEATRHPAVTARLLADIEPNRATAAPSEPAKTGGGGCAPVLVTLPFRAVARLFSRADAHVAERYLEDR